MSAPPFPVPAVKKTKGAFPPHQHEERKVGDGGKTGEYGETEKAGCPKGASSTDSN